MRKVIRFVSGAVLLCSSMLAHAGEVSLDHNGLTLTANLETASEGWKDAPVLLMTHGTLAHNRMEIMDALQHAVKDRGYTSLAINLSLGLSERSGMYDCATPHTHRHTDALDEIGLWLAWLKEQGVTSVVLLGHSRGGNQTAWFGAERDDPAVRGLVLVAPATWGQAYASEDYKKRYGKPLEAVLAQAEQAVEAGAGERMLQAVDFIYCAQTSATAEAFVSYYRPDERMDTPHLVARLDKPVLVVAGSEDNVVANLIEKMEPLAAAEQVELAVIDGADHFFRDLYAEELADLVTEFVEAH